MPEVALSPSGPILIPAIRGALHDQMKFRGFRIEVEPQALPVRQQ